MSWRASALLLIAAVVVLVAIVGSSVAFQVECDRDVAGVGGRRLYLHGSGQCVAVLPDGTLRVFGSWP